MTRGEMLSSSKMRQLTHGMTSFRDDLRRASERFPSTGCPLEGTDQSRFEAWVDQAVTHALSHPYTDFAELTACLPGIYPQEVFRALGTIPIREPRFEALSEALASSAQRAGLVAVPPSGLLGLPPPHPLDFEWRFSPEAIDVLGDAVNTLTPLGESLALVGTPTFAATPSSMFEKFAADYYGVDGQFLEKCGAGAHLRRIVSVDLLCAPEATDRYATVIMDPPWYDEHVRRFLHFAATVLRDGGYLLLAMPAVGTRPGIAEENIRILTWAKRLGLVLESAQYGTMPYETPPFERNSLRAAGIMNVGDAWRRGDLWILRKQSADLPDWPGDIYQSTWREFMFGPVRVRVDARDGDTGADPSLQSIVDGDVLPSVSRRDQRRAAVRVWTTGNRVYACEAPAKLASMLEAWSESETVPQGPLVVDQRVRDHIYTVIAQECAELAWPDRSAHR